ncbi:MAG TPA: ABC transporter ATP-binding protein [Actinomycetota bacterium]|nr:ABC transporter ATP-binding protein [Actinomycetota bacterium]
MAGSLALDMERRYQGGAVVRAALEVPLEPPGVTVLFGPSGSGKTTILRCVAGLERPDRGTIRFGEEVWTDAESGRHVPPQRRRVGFLHQEPALFPHRSVRGNVAFGLRRVPRDERRARVAELLERFGLAALADRRPGQLSGGERQRVALARALAPSPRLLLLDEPLSALDTPTREELRLELRRHLIDAGVPSLLVTHDRAEAMVLGDRVAVVIGGEVRQVGAVEDVFSHPVDAEVARAVGVETVVVARVRERHDGLLVLETHGRRLVAVDPGLAGEHVLACIRAEEVVLRLEEPVAESARNHLAATVVALRREGPLDRIVLDCGFELTAVVTPEARRELGLEPGRRVVAVVKAPAVHCVPRGPWGLAWGA